MSKKLACARLVDHDDRYQLENAAKFRAVNQQVATYDEFKAIVDGCHLKVSKYFREHANDNNF